MVSEIDQKKRFLQQPSNNAAPSEREGLLSLGQVWVSAGGVAANGMEYASPSHAVAWGNKGCPLLARDVRERHRGVQLPQDLERVFGASLTVDQLDSGVLELLSNDTRWQPPPREFRDFLYSMTIPAAQVAIPAGIPLAWIEDLPITGRTRGAVRRAFREAGAGGYLKVSMLAREFLSIREVGMSILNDLTCVIESAELGRTGEGPTMDLHDVALQLEAVEYEHLDALLQIAEGNSSFSGHLCEFARWAMAETDAQTFGEAISELIREGAPNEVWKPVASASLTDLAAHPPHPYEVLDKWMEQMDTRSLAVYMARVACQPDDIVTLEELGGNLVLPERGYARLKPRFVVGLKGFSHRMKRCRFGGEPQLFAVR